MANNEAVICKLANITKIEGADKIVSAQVMLNGISLTQVVVGVDTKENTPIVYFDSNLSINQEIIDKIDKLSPDYGKEEFKGLGTYLARGNRVRCIKLRSTISNGLSVEVDKFYQFFKNDKEAISTLVEGYTFTSIDGLEICKKWLPTKRASSINSNKKTKKNSKNEVHILEGHFPEHQDTEQLIRNIHKINPDDIIQNSVKYHGTSSRTGNVLVERKLNIFEKILSKFIPIQKYEYHYAYGSRRVTKKIDDIKMKGKNLNHFYSFDLWTDAGEKYFKGKLHKGENVYYEIVGWTSNGTPIQKIGKYIYNYGAEPNTYKIFVYRITLTNEDGYTVELDTQTVRRRGEELGVNVVEQLYYGKAKDLFPELSVTEHWHKNFLERLKQTYLEKDCDTCLVKGTPDEGIVVRREVGYLDAFKLKSERFLTGESEAYTKETNVDIEEQEVSDSE